MLPVNIPDPVKRFSQREFIGESLIWAHQPPAATAAKGGLVLWFFAVPWTAFALLWEGTAIHQFLNARKPGWGGLIMVLWGVPFVLIGLGMMAAPWWAWRDAKRSVWVLTNKRLVLLTEQWKSIAVRSVFPEDILAIERNEMPDGSGRLKLTYQSTRDSDGDHKERSDTFYGVADVRGVEEMIRALKANKAR